MSTDKSVDIMREAGVQIIDFDTDNQFEERVLINIRNTCWKESKADWVIICDMDEFIYHPNILKVLEDTDATHIAAEGYEMMSETLPTGNGQLYDELRMGFFKPRYSKPCIFKPSEIEESNFDAGSHYANPTGNVRSIDNSGIKLLHYKYLNRDALISKYARYKIRQSEEMRRIGWGEYQVWGPDELNAQFDSWLLKCSDVIN